MKLKNKIVIFLLLEVRSVRLQNWASLKSMDHWVSATKAHV